MTEKEFREQMQQLYFEELAVRRNPEELAKIVTKKQALRREYRKSLFEEMTKKKEEERKFK